MTVTVKELLTEALESRLDARTSLRDGKAATPKSMRAYDALRHLRRERMAIEPPIARVPHVSSLAPPPANGTGLR